MLEVFELFSDAPIELQVMVLGVIVIAIWEVLKNKEDKWKNIAKIIHIKI